ncbi:MAG: NAD(P)H-hydrate dehydratase [Candidatus Dadabacteria bacterium]|nr:NAD(P)H-hydrate dehydratase [Candidatus Dadabacteria bacterium]NIS08276.1 NAD(P)H-hydrate dehydratase [Candidatus Dadabacteria bacterium]NIY21761.1 NAD(P)H-hydrate dehydratase [Candidatus Dadabacteria bacterium]
MKIATREQVREIDRAAIEDYKIPGIVLMENAGRSVAEVIINSYPDAKKIAVFCGIGNNGGDGFVIARHLISKDINAETFICGDPKKYKGDALTNYRALKKMGSEIVILDEKLPHYIECELIVDCIFGTGLDREVKGFYAKLIEFLNRRSAPILSVDIPSGLDANSARPLGCCIEAEKTLTFALPKIGNVIYPGLDYCGDVYLSGITTPAVLEESINVELLTAGSIKPLLNKRNRDTHKGTYGHLFIIAGSAGKSGASVLSALGAERIGSGLTTVGIPKSLNAVIEEKLTEAMTEPLPETKDGLLGNTSLKKTLEIISDKKTALAIGPGISTSKQTESFMLKLLKKCDIPVVIDADAITLISKNLSVLKNFNIPVVLTPHPGEMARLIGKKNRDVQDDRIDVSRSFSRKYGVYLVLKGARTVISTPDGKIFINPTGNPGMAAGGMGDVLTGIIGGLLAQGYNAENSCKIGVFLHGLAGDMASKEISESGFLASEVADLTPKAINEIKRNKVREYIYRVY